MMNFARNPQRLARGLSILLVGLALGGVAPGGASVASAAEAMPAAASAPDATVAESPTVAIAASAKTPHQMVEQSTNALIEFVESARPWAQDEPDRYYREVEALLSPVVDFRNFSRGVMAANYKKANAEQRERFRESFKWGLVRTYSLALTEFDDGKVTVLPPDREPENPRRQRVKMEITTPSGEVYPVVYAVRQGKDERWRIYNLVVNGVNMGLTFRSQFASAMKDRRYGGDLDQVIDAWAAVVADADAGASES